MSEVHIEGMGILGCMLARRLHQEGVSFTWNDTREPFVAWPVSTGLAYPDGDPINAAGLERWREILNEGELIGPDEAVEAPYAFAHKSPPHGGRYPFTDLGKLRLAEPRAVSLNPITFVNRTREVFAAEELDEAPGESELVIAHTTPKRGDGYLWGWVAKVALELPLALQLELKLGEQPALYAKKHRFNLTYAYPIPGTGLWWAGSVLRLQREPKRVDDAKVGALYEEWERDAEELLGVTEVVPIELGQGWRPRNIGGVHTTGLDLAEYDEDEERWYMPVMPTDGVRRGWLVVDDLVDRLTLL